MPIKKLTEKKLMEFNPCSDGLEFARKHEFDFAKIYRLCPRADWLIWLLRRTDNITKPQAVEMAIKFAAPALARFEKKYPDDKRPRAALDAAKAWLANPTEANKILASAARCEARKAANGIWSIYYAAADAAAAADADAAAAADAAADAAAAAAAAWRMTHAASQKTAAKIVRAIVRNPFI